jgi:hypothetical protein
MPAMTVRRLIFTDDLVARARAEPEDRRRLLYRWATFEGPAREAAREQLDAAAQLVPVEQRRRVLGQLHSDNDTQVTVTIGILLLAKVFTDQRWTVEHEPEVSGQTPDLRIRKGDVEFLIEARHVQGDFAFPPALQRLKAALKDMPTRTPARFTRIEADARASLRGFKAFLRRVVDQRVVGPQRYEERGVLIEFELEHSFAFHEEVDVFLSYAPEDFFCFNERDVVRAALDEKLKKYPFPLIVALQGIDTGDLFRAAEDELFGAKVIEFPISHATGGPVGPPQLARANDSGVSRRNADGARVRARLNALLPFEVSVKDRGLAVRARVLANPAKPDVVGLDAFQPIPTLRHVGQGAMRYFGSDGVPVCGDEPLADLFIP